MTSEQKLLQLIRRSPKERKSSPPPLSSAEPVSQGWMTETAWAGISRFLMIAVAVLLVVLVWRYQVLRETYAAPVEKDALSPAKTEPLPPVRPAFEFDDFKNTFSSRNIFVPPAPEVPEEVPQPPPPPPVAVVPQIDLSKQYRVVGIALGTQPTAIVENIQTASTVFLGVGDKLDQAVVKDIQQDKVILELNGQTVELKS